MRRLGAFARIVFCLIVVSLTFTSTMYSDVTGKKKFRKEQAFPIKLGTSGGNVEDQNDFFCCSGTLGALVENSAGTQFILSNNHVFAIANTAHKGDAMTQPGLIDKNCNASLVQVVAFLSKFTPFKFGGTKKNLVDAAIAEVVKGAVDPSGEILSIGVPGSDPVEAALGMGVKKSGRTTGLTKGTVIVLDANILVDIDPECGGTNGKPTLFVDQVIVDPDTNKPFVLAGDSGSLIVENVGTCPAPVGLLAFGDSSGVGGFNRIQNVNKKLKITEVGCTKGAASAVAFKELSMEDPRILAAKTIKDQHIDELFQIPGVAAAGLGLTKAGSDELAILIFVKKGPGFDAAAGMIPARLGNLPVVIRETSGFKTM